MKKIIGLLLLILVLTGCSAKGAAEESVSSYEDKNYEVSETSSSEFGFEKNIGDRKIIFKGQVTLRIASYQDAAQEIEEATMKAGGYVSESNISEGYSHLVLKIPASEAKNFLNGFEQFGTVIDSRFTSDDVTEQFTNLEIRTTNLEVQIATLRELLKKDDIKVEDIFKIENEIRRLVDELEGYQGQIRNLSSRVSFSEIVVSLTRETELEVTNGKTFGYEVSSAFKTGVNGIVELVQLIIIVGAFLVPWLPVVLVIGLTAIMIRRRTLKKGKE
ncbi:MULTISPECIES: DUF4349 domain-containing protein [unclassified Fusibacter]|uniref:DUF4349 domain-containing protein n=1 Tax=unclassified Fusibacter TaxID=2624464 RepID=UPI0010127967|nr:MULTISPECIES: DUF4349 domain-containing protein [unclassified Fusibacter]MCK8060814.1 DUF4349 domain-containing protein [Fusibacter sp. A2]NPE23110.1 DUF4349 domain-containing protein [Fusibacter sp. A1]RXV59781.1 DUF4349 domain-containing protein [Fusibacter sp. A1]